MTKEDVIRVFAFLILFAAVHANAQYISHLGVEDGLNGRHAFNFQQDKKGFIWISTGFGVDRYDGNELKNYPISVIDEHHYIVRMFRVLMDRDTVLWAYTDRGSVYKYNGYIDDFELVYSLSQYVRTLHFDRLNRIWIGSKSNLGELQDGVLVYIDLPELEGLEVRSICDFDDENLLITTDKEIFLLDPEQKSMAPLLSKHCTDCEDMLPIESVYYDSANHLLWIGTLKSGLFSFDYSKDSLSRISGFEMSFNPILTILPVNERLLFIGTDGAGAWLIDRQSMELVQSYRENEEMDFPLIGEGIYDIYKDRDGRIWISTYSGGVNILNFGRQGFHVMRHEENNPNSLAQNLVSCVLEDSHGRLWFGSQGGISILNRENGVWNHFLGAARVQTIHEDSRGYFWVGTFGEGVYVLDRFGRKVSHYLAESGKADGIGTNFVYAIMEDSRGDIWIGGKRGPLSRFDTSSATFTQLDLNQVNHITHRDEDHILIACETGVFELSLSSGEFQACPFIGSLHSRYVCDIYVESDSIVWLATYGDGLNRYSYLTGTINRFNQQSGLNSDFVYAILDDADGNIWFSSENGIGKLDIRNDSIVNFFVGDGISENQFTQVSREKTREGTLFFGSYGGVTYFHPDRIIFQEFQSRLVLLDFSLFNQVVYPGEDHSPLKDMVDEVSAIQLSHKQHSFSLSFTTVDFSPAGDRKYMWMLEGLNEDWIGPSSAKIVNYTNLSPKAYTFRVKALGHNNSVLDERELAIIVKPPFWEAPWARISGILLLLSLFYWIFRYIRNELEKRESENKIRFFINTAHDIRTPLTLISAPVYELKESLSTDKKHRYLLNLITTNLEKLNNMFSQLLDFQKVYEAEDQLVVRKRDINAFLHQKIMHWTTVAENLDVKLELELPEKAPSEWIDSEKMNKILDNLISNALKYTSSQGIVKVTLQTYADYWQIDVKDTGIGIPKSDQKKLFRRFFRASNAVNSREAGSGLGLLLVKNYVELHGGEVGVRSEENAGSEFYIRFLHGSDHFRERMMLDDARLPILEEDIGDEPSPGNDRLKTKILIVEDNLDLRSYLKLSLSHYYKVYEAGNGLEAWEKIFKFNPDMVVSDLQMPGMNGIELCEKIKTSFETSHIPVILLTVMSDKESVAEGINTGADDYISKPFDLKYLRLKIDNIVNNRNILRKKFLDNDQSPANEIFGKDAFNQEFIRKATRIIEDRMEDSSLSVADLSREMALSRSLLYMKFHTITGYTPNDFIKVIRMRKAIQYFRKGTYSIHEVSHLVGFREPGYFSTCFRKIYGKTPKQFMDEDL